MLQKYLVMSVTNFTALRKRIITPQPVGTSIHLSHSAIFYRSWAPSLEGCSLVQNCAYCASARSAVEV